MQLFCDVKIPWDLQHNCISDKTTWDIDKDKRAKVGNILFLRTRNGFREMH